MNNTIDELHIEIQMLLMKCKKRASVYFIKQKEHLQLILTKLQASLSITIYYINALKMAFLFLGALHVPLIALSQSIGAHDADLSVGVQLLSGEILLQVKNSTGHRWVLNPRSCRQHSYCRKHPKPLQHLDFLEIISGKTVPCTTACILISQK